MKTSYSVLILDDDPVQCLLLEGWLELVPGAHLAASLGTVKECLRYLHEHEVDLILLDIYLPDLNGLSMVKSLPQPPKIIIQSSSEGHALEGFDVGAVDYLVKPFTFERFAKAMHRALPATGMAETAAAEPQEDEAFVFLKVNQALRKVYFREIMFAEAMQNYSRLRLANGAELVTLVGLKRLHEQLSSPEFLRAHKSFIINLKYVEALGVDTVVVGTHTVPMGGAFREKIETAWVNARIIAR